jgi:Ca2+-binding EF-hand superfamily protein
MHEGAGYDDVSNYSPNLNSYVFFFEKKYNDERRQKTTPSHTRYTFLSPLLNAHSKLCYFSKNKVFYHSMGNDASSPRMAFSAVAEMVQISRPEFFELRNKCLDLTKSISPQNSKTNNIMISRSDFLRAMKEMQVHSTDIDIFTNLFEMWDKRGSNGLDLLLFLTCIAPLASTLDVMTKLQFSFEVFDVHRTGQLMYDDAIDILEGINATASYFGDPVVEPQMIHMLVDDIYQDQNEMYYMQILDLVCEHEVVLQFASASGTMRYGGVPRQP